MIISAFLVIFIASTASSAVLGADCPKQFPKEMRPLWKCCTMEMNPNSTGIADEEMASIKKCFSDRNSSQTNAITPPSGYDCELECVSITLGYMGEDKTINKPKLSKFMEDQLSVDFHEAANNALETCMGRKYNTHCPSGIDGVLKCLTVQIMVNCPEQHWTGDEDCKESKQLMEKCGETTSLFPDYDEDDEDN